MSDYQGNIIIKNPATPTGPSTYGSAPGMWKLNEVAYWIKQGLWPDTNIVPDLYFPYVSLLLSTTSLGNANNNLFVDSSGAFNPVSRFGNTTQGSFTPYSTNWSNYFAGAGSYLQTPANSATTIVGTLSSTANLTIECWIFPTAYNSSANFPGLIGDMVATAENNNWSWGITNTGTLMLYWNISGTQYRASTTSTVSLNTWTHIALNVAAGAITMYINGVSQTLTGTTTLGTPSGSNNYLVIGQWNNGSGGTGGTSHGLYTGYISNLRVVKASTYTSNFTVPTAPLSAITSTSLLTCQSNRFRDASTNNLTLTVAGNMAVTDFGPFSPSTYAPIAYNQSDITNWSGYFDGSGDYISAGSNAAFAFGTGAYTTEAWVYITGSNSLNNLFCNDSTNGFDLYFNYSSNTTLLEFRGGSNIITFSGVPTRGTWTHVALVREGTGTNQTKLYFNGVLQGSGTDATNWTVNGPMLIGAIAAGADLNGYISNARIVKGTAVYTATFTPPTSPLTAISGTSLLTLQNAAFTDNSTNNFVITPNGNVTVTGNSPFNTVGYWSNYFNGSSYLAAANNAAIQLGTGAFTIEGWFNIPSYAANQPLFDQRASGPSSNAFVIYVKTTGTLAFYSYSPGIDVTFNTVISTNAWNHFAFVRSGNTGTMYVNGVAQSTTIDLSAYNNTSSANRIMQSFDPSYATGYLSNFRIVKGTAVYTANFTPPTAPLTAISGTGLLTCQSSRFIDSSSNALTITVNGSPSVQSFDPFYTSTIASNGGSMYFDGSGDYLQVPRAANLLPGTNDFTLEAWVYPTTTGTTQFIMGFLEQGVSGDWSMFRYTNDTLGIYTQVNGDSFGGVIARNQWNHVALSRVNGTLYKCVNGSATTVSWAGTLNSNLGYNLTIGADNAGDENFFTGWMYGTRIINGTGLYSSTTYTVPTTPFTPTANTSFLLNGMNAGVYDATTINDMETVGNAQVSTVQSKFGGSSMYFDGSGDSGRIAVNQPALQFGTSNFTAEGWVYSTGGTGTYQHILTGGTSWTTGSGGIYWYYNGGSPTLGAAWNQIATNPAVNSGTLSINTWYHFALVRNGNTMTLYINGTSVSSISVTGVSLAFNNQSRTNIGGGGWDNDFAGYIDDLRVTNGIARYTSNFTPPTQAFPVY